jgi:hypothetical protein
MLTWKNGTRHFALPDLVFSASLTSRFGGDLDRSANSKMTEVRPPAIAEWPCGTGERKSRASRVASGTELGLLLLAKTAVKDRQELAQSWRFVVVSVSTCTFSHRFSSWLAHTVVNWIIL